MMKKTSLYSRHVDLGAKLVDFAGYQMPIQYSGVMNEHNMVRKSAGLFDVSHMGEFIVSGDGAEEFLNYITINDLNMIEPWQAQYSAMCFEDGGIIDDLIIYRYPDHFMLVVNCANIEKDLDWLMANKPLNVDIMDISQQTSLIALQGPNSRKILQSITDVQLDDISFYCFKLGRICNETVTISRTGYTGELGYEIYGSNEKIIDIWDAIISEGGESIHPVGLACRDTLRTEMKYALYGNDIDDSTNPLEAGLGWITKLDKINFIGKNALINVNNNLRRKLVCIKMKDRGIPRKGYILMVDDAVVGEVTSGTQSPSLNEGIGLAYVSAPHAELGTELKIKIRKNFLNCVIIKPPFYKNGSLHK
jgi:aminomethyltransferase